MNVGLKRWRYMAEDSAGAVVDGVIDAADRASAGEALRLRRLIPLTLKESSRRSLPALQRGSSSGRLTIAELARVTARLRDLLRAGIPATPALRLAADQATAAREREFLRALRADIESGRTLTAALARSRFETPRLVRALVEAGEALGDLARQFDRLAAHFDEALKLRREMAAQLAYPAALLVLVVATLFFLSFFVLRQFEQIFESALAPPPPETRFVIAAGAFVREYGAFAPAILLALFAVGRLAVRRYPGAWEEMRLSAPVAGRLLKVAEFGAYFRTLATLIGGGATLARSLPLARDAMSIGILRAEVDSAENSVRVGERLSASLSLKTRCPRDLISYIEIGEETGALAAMTGEAAARAETLLRTAVQRILSLLAPMTTALMGLVTAGVIAAVMTGVLSLSETIQ